ncbi:MAG TPA: Grx4 family monothiol glutaredoxin [Polyangiaceae bacterium]|nr:Grx4 family monothiol glutaredoxin [Polyangiaceae bacterium]
MALSASLRNQISELVTQNPVVLFMKGNRQSPQCGFSAQVVQILDELVPEYETVDVLSSPELRDGIKEFSEWPTIPQLYVGGKFIGGCDIVRELHASHELQALVGGSVAAPATPDITLSDAAREAFQAALEEAAGEVLHLKVDSRFQYDLFFAPPEPGDIRVSASGLELFLDAASARRAQALSIDFVEGPSGGFKIENPNEPAKVKPLSAVELKAMLEREAVVLFDVRPEPERAIASIAAARPLDAAGQQYLSTLDRSTPIAFHCHHGVRSQDAAEQLLRMGFKVVYNLRGGIDEWSQSVDPAVPRY